jgi:two-component system response regulator
VVEKRLLLLVEDNPDDEEVTLRGLRKADLSNCLIQVSRDGQAALDWLFGDGRLGDPQSGHQPDLILLDLSLPRVSGLDVLKRIRANDRTSLTPVVILTSSLEAIDRHRCYLSGANSYLQKPTDFDQYVETVRQLGVYWMELNESA